MLLAPPKLITLPWLHENSNPIENLHSFGRWYYFEYKNWTPQPPEGVDMVAKTYKGVPLIEVFHGASMYTFWSSVVHGLHPGPKPGKGGKIGLYTYRNISRHLAKSSSGYVVHSDLGQNGIYYGPRYRVFFSAKMLEEAGEAWSAGQKQIVLKEGFFFVTGVYIHAVTPQDVRSRRDCTDLWMYADEWHADVEMF